MDIDCTSGISALKLSASVEYPRTASNDEADIDLIKISLWEQFAKKIELAVDKMHQFNEKMIFNQLSDHDVTILLRFRFFEVWICLMSPRTNANSITFEDGTCFSIAELELLYDHDFVNQWIKFILSLKSYQLTDVELELFAGVVFYSQRSYLTEVETVKKVQSYLIEDLNNKITSKIASASIKPPTFDISQQLSELSALYEQQHLSLKWLKMNWNKVKIPEVVSQIYGIPYLLKMPKSLEDLSSGLEAVESQKIWMWNQISKQATLSVQYLFDEANMRSGFYELMQTDRFCLIKQGFFELMFITMSVKACDSAIVFGVIAFSRQQLELVYDSDFVNDLIQLSLTVKRLSLVEIKWIISAVLFTQRPGLTNVEAVKKSQDDAFENFANERKKRYANDTPPTFELKQKILEINQLGLRHSNFLNWVKKNSMKLQLSSLFCEILDFNPKDETI